MQFIETRRQEGEAVAIWGLTLQYSELRRPGQGTGLEWRLLAASSSSDSSGAWPPGRLPRADSRLWFPRGVPGRAVPTAPHTSRWYPPWEGVHSCRSPAPPTGSRHHHAEAQLRGAGSLHIHTLVFHLGKPGPQGAKAGAGKTQGSRPSLL